MAHRKLNMLDDSESFNMTYVIACDHYITFFYLYHILIYIYSYDIYISVGGMNGYRSTYKVGKLFIIDFTSKSAKQNDRRKYAKT